LLLCDLGAVPSRNNRPGRLLHPKSVLSSAACSPIARSSVKLTTLYRATGRARRRSQPAIGRLSRATLPAACRPNPVSATSTVTWVVRRILSRACTASIRTVTLINFLAATAQVQAEATKAARLTGIAHARANDGGPHGSRAGSSPKCKPSARLPAMSDLCSNRCIVCHLNIRELHPGTQ
jgi:hypothetical protein